MVIDSTALRYFLEVARSGSITAASERIHVAASAVSRQIVALEQRMGVALFERNSRGMSLTLEGELLANYGRRCALDEQKIVSEIRNQGKRATGTIRMAASEGLASHFVPDLVHAYRTQFPEIRFTVRSQSPEGIAREVREGEADVGIAFAAGYHQNIVAAHRLRVRTCIMVAPGHPLARLETATLRDVEPYPVVTSKVSTMRRLLDLRSALDGIQLDIVLECNYSATLFNYACYGGGVAFAAELSARKWLERGDLVAIPLADGTSFERNIEIQVMEGRSLPGYVEDWIKFVARELGVWPA